MPGLAQLLDRQVQHWPGRAAVGVCDSNQTSAITGEFRERFEWASVTKLITAMAALVAVEEASTSLDEAAGPAQSTLRHLLSHASGLAPDAQRVLCPPATRRIYSNSGIELAASHLELSTGISFGEYLFEGVLAPLSMTTTALTGGSPAWGASGSLEDLLSLGRQLLAPTLVSPLTLAEATSVAFPGLAGVLPGFGLQDPNDWGCGFELRDKKSRHWTGASNSPATFGHFGRSGSFLWVDPQAGLACAGLSDQAFGPWAIAAWPALADAILAELRG